VSRPAPVQPQGQLTRLLALVPYLLARPGVRVADVAATFGVPEERLRKDLDLLWVCGLPGHGPGDLIDVEILSGGPNSLAGAHVMEQAA